MTAKMNGIVEPVVMGVGEEGSSPDSVTAGSTVKGVGVAAGSAAVTCSEAGPIAAAVCAVGAAIVSAFKSLGDALKTTPDDARRFLYELGYMPGKELKTARIVSDVSAIDMEAIRRARYLEIAGRSNQGLDTVNGWLEKAGETDGDQKNNPMSPELYFAHMADAHIQAQIEAIVLGHDDVKLPVVKLDFPGMRTGDLQRAVLDHIRQDPARYVGYLRDPATIPGAQPGVANQFKLTSLMQQAGGSRMKPTSLLTGEDLATGRVRRFANWVGGAQVFAFDRDPNPIAPFLPGKGGFDWLDWALAAAGVATVGFLGFAAYQSRSRFQQLLDEVSRG